jgi:hypothetical protein
LAAAISDHPLPRRAFSGPRAKEPIVAGPNWKRIDKAPKGIGPLLLRAGPGPLDASFVGYEADDGRWFAAADNRTEVDPTHFALIPLFDADDDGAVA